MNFYNNVAPAPQPASLPAGSVPTRCAGRRENRLLVLLLRGSLDVEVALVVLIQRARETLHKQ